MTRHIQRILAGFAEEGALCNALGFYGQLSIYSYMIVHTITVYNTAAHFLNDKRLTERGRKLVFVGGVVTSLIMCLSGLVLGSFGLDHDGYCMYTAKVDGVSQTIVRIYTLYIPLVPLYIYNLIVPIYVVYRLNPKCDEDTLPVIRRMIEQEAITGMRTFLGSIRRRILTFPAHSFLTITGFILHFVLLDVFHRPVKFFEFWYNLGLGLSGTFFMVGLMFHPSFLSAVCSLYFGTPDKTQEIYETMCGGQDDDVASVYSDDFVLEEDDEKPQANSSQDDSIQIEIRKFSPIDMPSVSRTLSLKPALDML
ncbi:hypothetical protein DSO57_1020164 [Entomophthora muscae]|nr:hypothetical protein DSO57_1020164 [Entomophthora muscae]